MWLLHNVHQCQHVFYLVIMIFMMLSYLSWLNYYLLFGSFAIELQLNSIFVIAMPIVAIIFALCSSCFCLVFFQCFMQKRVKHQSFVNYVQPSKYPNKNGINYRCEWKMLWMCSYMWKYIYHESPVKMQSVLGLQTISYLPIC